MRNVFAFFHSPGDPQLEREFRSVYQQPSIRYLRIAFLLALVALAGFFAMDAVTGRLDVGSPVSKARIGLIAIFGLGAFLIERYRTFVARFYGAVVNLFCLLGIQAAALFPLAVHGGRSSSEFHWSLNTSLVTAIIVIYGFSRLTARSTTLIVFTGCVTGGATALVSPLYDPYYFGRLTLNLVIVIIVSYSLRQSIERRERQLFLLARENLRRNIYAQELEAAKTRAVEADQVKMRFLANMSHEFCTPMSGVVQTLEVVGRTATGETAKLVARAIAASNAFLRTVNGILDYTRWSEAAVPVSPTTVGLSALVRRVVSRHAGSISQKGLALRLRLDLTASEDYVRTDEVILTEVLSHILANAVRFTDAGGIDFGIELRAISVNNPGEVSIEVAVSDTGIGIPADLQPLLGTAFYQVDNASNRKVGGTGLGLAIVTRLVPSLGGTWSLSSAEGRGTTVRLSIPSERVPAPPGVGALRNLDFRQRPVEKLGGMVLLVEDNELNAALAKDLLGLMGLDVTLAMDGREAVAVTAARRFDIVLMDCQMPVMDGYAATRAIRKDEQERGLRRTPIVAVTANALAGDRENCLASGMDDHLAKPYTAAQLREVLATWLPQGAGADRPAAPSGVES